MTQAVPHIALLCEYPTLSGGERSMLAVLPGVIAAGYRVTVVAPPTGPLAESLRRLHVDVIGFPELIAADAPAGESRQSRLRERLADHLRYLRPDLLHANSLAMSRLAGPVVAESAARGVGHLRDIMRLSHRAVTDLNRMDRVFAVSHATRDYHVTGGLHAHRVRVLYNGVDLTLFRPRRPSGYLHRELRLPSRPAPGATGVSPVPDGPHPDPLPEGEGITLIASIGQICLRKGQDVFLKAASRVADERGDVHFLVVGKRHSTKRESSEYEHRLRQFAEQKMPGRVHWLGSRADVARLLPELTLLIHAARQEPLGRVLLESAAAGVPVVATDVGGTREIFPDGEAAIVPVDDSGAMADAAIALLGDPTRRCAMSAAARRRAEGAFPIARAVEETLGHYSALLFGAAPPPVNRSSCSR